MEPLSFSWAPILARLGAEVRPGRRRLRFYQRRGFVLLAVHKGAIEKSRRLKPAIPAVGHFGIPITDEIELEKAL